MYINDTHIMYYAVVAILGLFVGMFVDWMNLRLPEYKKVFTKEIKEYFIKFKPNYILMLLTSAIYVALLYNYSKFRFNKIYDINTNVIISICNRLQITNNTKQTKPNNV